MAQTQVLDHSLAWFAGRQPASSARVRLFCFPYAGLGVSAFRGWAEAFPADVDVLPVQLPGRESRHHEPPFRRMDFLTQAVSAAIRPFLDVPFALMGHSLGGAVAFEVARQLPPGAPLRRVFISARRAPHLSDPQAPIAHLPDAQFIEAVQLRYSGIPAAVLAEPELLMLLLPRLRADLEVLEQYEFRPGRPLGCPISVYGGADDPTVTRGDLDAWQQHTSAGASVRLFPGPHLFLLEQRAAIVSSIVSELGVAGWTGGSA